MLSPDQDVDYWSDENLPPEMVLNKDAKRPSGIPEWVDIFDKKWVRGYLTLCAFDDGKRIVAVSLMSNTILYIALQFGKCTEYFLQLQSTLILSQECDANNKNNKMDRRKSLVLLSLATLFCIVIFVQAVCKLIYCTKCRSLAGFF